MERTVDSRGTTSEQHQANVRRRYGECWKLAIELFPDAGKAVFRRALFATLKLPDPTPDYCWGVVRKTSTAEAAQGPARGPTNRRERPVREGPSYAAQVRASRTVDDPPDLKPRPAPKPPLPDRYRHLTDLSPEDDAYLRDERIPEQFRDLSLDAWHRAEAIAFFAKEAEKKRG